LSEQRSTSPLWPGVPMALLSALLFGASTPVAKLLLGAMEPWLLAGLLYAGAGCGLAVVLMIRRAFNLPHQEAPLASRDLPWLALVIVFGGILGPVLMMYGLSRTTASSSSLLLNLESIATMVIAWVAFRENVDRRLLLGAFAIVSGAVLLSWKDGDLSIDIGAVAVAGACVCWGIDNNLTRKLSAADPVVITVAKGIVAGVVNLTLAASYGATWPSTTALAIGAVTGLIGYGASLVLFVLALRHLGTARTGAYYSIAPFAGAILSIAVLAEPVTPALAGAFLLMAFGVYVHLTEHHEHEHIHERMVHAHRHIHDEHHQHVHTPDYPVGEPHTHSHVHAQLRHTHAHYPDLHHRHDH
jgi:drug/metabolite transporter (DMT)-like permease